MPLRPLLIDPTSGLVSPASVNGHPLTLPAGARLTDFNSLGDARWSLLGHTHPFASITSKPTTISGYGITDAEPAINVGTSLQFWRGDKTFQTLNTAAVPESGSLYFTNARAVAAPLTGYVSGGGAITATDSVLVGIQKNAGNIAAIVTPANTTSTASNFFTAYNSGTGVFTKGRPVIADLSDAGQLAAYAAIAPSANAQTLLGHTFSQMQSDLSLVPGTNVQAFNSNLTTLTTSTLGDLPYSSAANTLSKLAGNITSTKKFLTQTGAGTVSAAPAWGTLAVGDIPDLSATYQPLDSDLTSWALITRASGFDTFATTPTLVNLKALVTDETTVGWNLLTLTNPGTITFLQLNADNSVTAQSASAQRTALGLGTLATQSGTFSGTSSGTNTGDQTITLTGDVTGAGTGSFATTLASVASAGTTGSSTAIPVVTINAKGLTTGITTAAVIAPAGTLSGATLASGVTASSLTSFGVSPALNTPVITGLPTGTGVAAAGTASTLASRDANANLAANNLLGDYTTTATAAGATTLTVGSSYVQFFTGSSTQTVTLPVASTLTLGHQFFIVNNSTGTVTVNSSGANAVIILAGGTSATITCILASGTSAASWNASYSGGSVASGKKLTASNSLTLAGTDATTMTFPTTSATIARTDAGNTFTGDQSITGNLNISSGKVFQINSVNVIRGENTHNNYFFGPSGNGSVSGDLNVGIGYSALGNVSSGGYNVGIGYNALGGSVMTGSDNLAIGANAISANTSGASNTAYGSSALTANTSGNQNVALGRLALTANTTGTANVAAGYNALADLNITANNGTGQNTAIGYNTGRGIVTGTNNTIVGANVTGLSSSLSNNIILADGAGNQRAVYNSGWTFSGAITLGAALSVANGGTGDTGTAWTTYTPTVTPVAGSFTTMSAAGRYKQLGKTVFVQMTITITTNGTAATGITATLPVTGAANATFSVAEASATGFAGRGITLTPFTSVDIKKYDNTYLGGSGNVIIVEGVYEAN